MIWVGEEPQRLPVVEHLVEQIGAPAVGETIEVLARDLRCDIAVLASQEPCDALGIARLLTAAADGEVVEVDAPAARLGDLEERQIGLAVQQ